LQTTLAVVEDPANSCFFNHRQGLSTTAEVIVKQSSFKNYVSNMQTPTYTRFLVTEQDHVAQVVINNPNKANALDTTAWQELKSIFTALNDNEGIRVIVLSGEGKHFCSGIDIQVLMQLQQEALVACEGRKREKIRQFIIALQQSINAIAECAKPVIAAVHGGCIGGGLDIVAACDMRYATEDAGFCLKEVDMGLVADLGVLQRLPRIIPAGLVREMAYTAKTVSGKEAHRIGLVTAAYPDKTVMMTEVQKIATLIAQKSPLTVRGLKQVMDYSEQHSVTDGLNYVATWNSGMILSNDLQEAVMAAMQKRLAQFEN
jgi:enoyl-CoA hydratase